MGGILQSWLLFAFRSPREWYKDRVWCESSRQGGGAEGSKHFPSSIPCDYAKGVIATNIEWWGFCLCPEEVSMPLLQQ